MKLLKTMMYIIELTSFFLFALINYFANTKMSMMRYVTYKNIYFEEKIFTDSIVNLLIYLLIFLILINLFLLIKRKYTFQKNILINVLILSLMIFFAKYFSIEKVFTYYYMPISISIVLLCEFIKIIAVMVYESRKNTGKF